jgi:hypothetical protein
MTLGSAFGCELVGSSAAPITVNSHNAELTLGDTFQTCKHASKVKHKVLATALNLCVAIFMLIKPT